MKKYSRAIGLLELMLALAIIAVLLIMATRYYSSASQSQKVTDGFNMVMALKAAATSYIAGNTGDATVTVKQLIDSGYLPASYQSSGMPSTQIQTPWMSTTVTISQSKGYLHIGEIYFTNYQPTRGPMCTSVMNKLNAVIPQGAKISGQQALGATCPNSVLQVYFAL